jgi:hypothetical protein
MVNALASLKFIAEAKGVRKMQQKETLPAGVVEADESTIIDNTLERFRSILKDIARTPEAAEFMEREFMPAAKEMLAAWATREHLEEIWELHHLLLAVPLFLELNGMPE